MERSTDWYEEHLRRYFDEHYGEYDETVEWYVNPGQNKWEFKVPELGVKIILRCNERGHVTEFKNYI